MRMLRPPDSSQSVRLRGWNARRQGPFEKTIWVASDCLEDVKNIFLHPARAAATFIKMNDVRGGRAEHDFRSRGGFPDMFALLSYENLFLLLFLFVLFYPGGYFTKRVQR